MKIRTSLLIVVVIATFLGVIYARACKHTYKDMVFINHVDQYLALHEYERLAGASEGKEKEHYLRLFFNALPRDFATFFKMTHHCIEGNIIKYGFRGDTYYTIYTDHWIYHNPWGRFHLKLKSECTVEEIPVLPISGKFPRPKERNGFMFLELPYEVQGVVPTEIYYEKLLSLGVDGFWDADDVAFLSMHISVLLYEDLHLSAEVLEKKSDDEIASFWYFLYDGPHPGHGYNRGLYENMFEKFTTLSPRIASLMKKAYDHLLSEEHCPCH